MSSDKWVEPGLAPGPGLPGFEISCDQQQTRELMLQFIWARFKPRLERSSGTKREFYQYLEDVVAELVEDITVELKNTEVHLHIGLGQGDPVFRSQN